MNKPSRATRTRITQEHPIGTRWADAGILITAIRRLQQAGELVVIEAWSRERRLSAVLKHLSAAYDDVREAAAEYAEYCERRDADADQCPECERSHGPHYRGRCDH